MRTTFLVLGALCCLASLALAGPNAGGVLWVHDTGILPSDWDIPLPPVSSPPSDCAYVADQVAMGSDPYAVSVAKIWKVYAAFPAASHPRLKGCAWGVGHPSVDGGQIVIMAADVPTSEVFYLTTGDWPADHTFIAMSFMSARVDPVDELYWFAGYAYAGAAGEPQSFCVIPHIHEWNRIFVDDVYPRHEDPIIDYGCLGFGTSGYTPCPVPDPNTLAACCSPEGECALTTEADCPAPSIWHAAEYDCVSNPCLPPFGACCDLNTGGCGLTVESECAFLWLGPEVPCNLETCPPPVPTQRTSWGGIKAIFR